MNDKNHMNVNEETTHSPLFQKIIQARVAAGYNSPQPSTLNSEELQAVETLREAISGETITLTTENSQELPV